MVVNDHLAYRYEVLGLLGKGSFGQVFKCYDHKTRTFRAIKIIRNKKRFEQQALVELSVLQHLRKHDVTGGNHVIHIQVPAAIKYLHPHSSLALQCTTRLSFTPLVSAYYTSLIY